VGSLGVESQQMADEATQLAGQGRTDLDIGADIEVANSSVEEDSQRAKAAAGKARLEGEHRAVAHTLLGMQLAGRQPAPGREEERRLGLARKQELD
jgi:hypothetical protein